MGKGHILPTIGIDLVLRALGPAAVVTFFTIALPLGALLAGFAFGEQSLSSRLIMMVAAGGVAAFILLLPFVTLAFAAFRKMELAIAQIKDLVVFDGLTRVMSRTYFLDSMRECAHDGYVLIIDADNFKRINDTYGHAAGDAALVQLAQAIERGSGDIGYVGRLGGEEFGVFLPRASRILAENVAEAIRARVESQPFMVADTDVCLTVSIGGAPVVAGKPLRNSLIPADENLYHAKAKGRNTAVFHTDCAAIAKNSPILRVLQRA